MVLFKYIHKCKWGIGACLWYGPTGGDKSGFIPEASWRELCRVSSFHGFTLHRDGLCCLWMFSACIVWIPASAGLCCHIPLHDGGSSSCQGCNQTKVWDVFCRLVQKSNLSHWRHCRNLWRWHDIGLVGWEEVCGWVKKSLTLTVVLCGIWVNWTRLKHLVNKGTWSTGH